MSRGRNTSGCGNPALAQFFTPSPVAEFMWQAVQLFAGRRSGTRVKVIDPAAGTGEILDAVLADVSAERVFGIEIDPELVRRRVGKVREAHFFTGDGLLGRFSGIEPGSFDVVIGNPPFGRLGDLMLQPAGEDEWEDCFAIWRAGKENRRNQPGGQGRQNVAVELLFVERALELCRSGGLIAFVMPEGFFANMRLQAARDWILERAAVLGVVDLPDSVFCQPGLRAKTAIIFLRRAPAGRREDSAVMFPESDLEKRADSLDQVLARRLRQLRAALQSHRSAGCLRVPAIRLKGRRWDARYWWGAEQPLGLDRRFPLAYLGDYIEHLTYGPIVTGRRPGHVEDGIQVIRQGDFAETGLSLDHALRVPEGSVYDPRRSRVRQRDLLLPRSGAGVLGRNRLGVYLDEKPANIGCFVDLIRLAELNPFFAWLFFKTRPGWQQIRALINGVGTPNINFSEIRSLRIPSIPPEEQNRLERRYLEEVWPLHCRRAESDAIRREGEERFSGLVVDLERFLEGRSCSVG